MKTARWLLLVFLASLALGLGGGLVGTAVMFGAAFGWSPWWTAQCLAAMPVLAMSWGLWWVAGECP